jgi:hypothetical protein
LLFNVSEQLMKLGDEKSLKKRLMEEKTLIISKILC